MADGWGLVRNRVVEKHFVLGRVGTWALKPQISQWQVLAISSSICVKIGVLSSITMPPFLSIMEFASWFLWVLSFGGAGRYVTWLLFPFSRAFRHSRGIFLKVQGLSVVYWGLPHRFSGNIGIMRGFCESHGKGAHHSEWLSDFSVFRKHYLWYKLFLCVSCQWTCMFLAMWNRGLGRKNEQIKGEEER